MAGRDQHQRPWIFAVAKQAALVGSGTGLAGMAIGGTSGLFISKMPGMFAVLSGAQCFTLGAAFTGARAASLELSSQVQKKPVSELPPNNRLLASTAGGASAAALVATLFRGRANILPGMLVWGCLGLAGQYTIDSISPKLESVGEQRRRLGIVERITASKWSPMSKLSDEEYSNMLKERLVRIEAEIALIEDDLDKLRVQETNLRSNPTE